jgi:hypothetical protein
MKFVATCLVSLATLSAAHAFAEPEIRLLGAPTLTGDCNDPTTDVQIVDTPDGQTFDLLVPALDAEADDAQPRVRKFCNIRQTVAIPDGYKLAPTHLKYQGLVDIAGDGGSGNISARYFLSGTPGVNGFRSFEAGEQGDFAVSTDSGRRSYTACGGTAELNFMADLTARIRPGLGSYSQVTVDRGIGDTRLRSVFHCGVEVVPCN